MHPVSFWTSLTQRGGPILVIAWICFMLASIPRWLTRKPKSYPEGTSKTHLVGLSFHCHAWILSLDYHIINIGFNIMTNLLAQASLDRALVCRSSVLEPKWHSRIAVGAKWSDKGSLALVFFMERNLMVTRVAINKG